MNKIDKRTELRALVTVLEAWQAEGEPDEDLGDYIAAAKEDLYDNAVSDRQIRDLIEEARVALDLRGINVGIVTVTLH